MSHSLIGKVWIYIIAFVIKEATCQSCIWEPFITPLKPSQEQGWAVGTPAEIKTMVSGTFTTIGERFSWLLDGIVVSQFRYTPAYDNFSESVPFTRGFASVTKNGSTTALFTLKFDSIEISDNNTILVANKQMCSTPSSPDFSIKASYCGPISGGSGVTVNTSGLTNDFMYKNSTTVSCGTGSSSVNLTCESDATWSQEGTCSGICCACLGGIVIIAISISGSISCIVVIILLGSDFVKGQIVICVVGGCSMILGIVCGAVPLRSCSNYVIWIGGDIASIALGSIGTFVTLIFLGYLIVVRCKPEYSLGKR